MDVKPGLRLTSTVCRTEVIVVKAPPIPIDLRCGGHHMVAKRHRGYVGGPLDIMHSDGTEVGQRYADEEVGLELLCTKAGDGSLSLGGQRLALKDSTPIPTSD
jgi:hypothetical protein